MNKQYHLILSSALNQLSVLGANFVKIYAINNEKIERDIKMIKCSVVSEIMIS